MALILAVDDELDMLDLIKNILKKKQASSRCISKSFRR